MVLMTQQASISVGMYSARYRTHCTHTVTTNKTALQVTQYLQYRETRRENTASLYTGAAMLAVNFTSPTPVSYVELYYNGSPAGWIS